MEVVSSLDARRKEVVGPIKVGKQYVSKRQPLAAKVVAQLVKRLKAYVAAA